MLLATKTATAKRAFRPGGTPSVVFPYLNPPLPLLRLSTFSLHLSPYLLYVSLPLSHSLLFPLLSLSRFLSPPITFAQQPLTRPQTITKQLIN